MNNLIEQKCGVAPCESTPHSITEETVISSTSYYTQEELKCQYVGAPSVKPNFFQGKQLLHNVVADYILKHYRVCILNELLHIYTNYGIYTSNTRIIERLIVELVPSIRIQGIKEVINSLLNKAPARTETDYRFVAFSNGVLNIETLEFCDFDCDKFVLTSRLNVPYNPSVLSNNSPELELVKSFLVDISCGDVGIQTIILQMGGYSFARTVKFRKSFILKGSRKQW